MTILMSTTETYEIPHPVHRAACAAEPEIHGVAGIAVEGFVVGRKRMRGLVSKERCVW